MLPDNTMHKNLKGEKNSNFDTNSLNFDIF